MSEQNLETGAQGVEGYIMELRFDGEHSEAFDVILTFVCLLQQTQQRLCIPVIQSEVKAVDTNEGG